jgi:enamine deaminase RidA (YjgF/YER057c/UK114 family)
MDQSEAVLKAAGLDMRHLVYANIYVTPQMPMKLLAEAIDEFFPDETAKTIIQTAALPFGAQLQISGVASRDLKRYGNCTGIADTVYCSARAGTIRQALESLKAELEVNKLSLTNTVAANVYMDDIAQFAEMNKVYAQYFPKTAPARTTVQPSRVVPELSMPAATDVADKPDGSPRAQVAIIAVR